jgi:DNA-binding NtrC family response regulator
MPTILLVDDDPLQAFARKYALKRYFDDVHRVTDAAEALCLIEQPQFAHNLGLVIAGHHAAGFGGPAFVDELHHRMPALNVIVIGNGDELPADYEGMRVRFIPRNSDVDELAAIAACLMEAREPTAA